MNREDFVYTPPLNQERRLVELHLEYVKQVQLEHPEIICSCPMCEWAMSQLDEVNVEKEFTFPDWQ